MTTESRDPDRNLYAGDENAGEGERIVQTRWAWWVMICAFAIGCTLLVVNWVGWQNLSVAARLIVLVELFLVSCLVLFLVLGERFAEWAGYGSLWANDDVAQSGPREGISRSDRNWSRTAQLKQYLRRTYYEVRCQQSTVISSTWRRTKPTSAGPASEQQRQNPPRRRDLLPQLGAGAITQSAQAVPQCESSAIAKTQGVAAQPAPEIPEAPETSSAAPATNSPRTCRPTSRLEIRRRQ